MTGGRSILLTEDHAESRTSLAYVLERRGDTVHQAANGRAWPFHYERVNAIS